MTAADVLLRARRSIGQGAKYVLGAGGLHPELDHPWNEQLGCDCSGFAMWALGLPRYDKVRWWDTSAIVHDARNGLEGSNRLFKMVSVLQAQPGDLFVYGDVPGHQGHVGVIATVTPLPESWPLTVIHCSSGNMRRTGDAIRETGPDVWFHRPDAIVARCILLTKEALA